MSGICGVLWGRQLGRLVSTVSLNLIIMKLHPIAVRGVVFREWWRAGVHGGSVRLQLILYLILFVVLAKLTKRVCENHWQAPAAS